jgi:GNAT superfamily N-acetyltransferase
MLMVELEKASEAELHQVMELFEETGHKIYLDAGATPEEVVAFLARRDWAEFWKERIIDPQGAAFLAKEEGKPLGMGFIWVKEEVASFGGLYVRRRREGIGSLLMEARLDIALKLGATSARLDTASNNIGMLALARKFSFEAEQRVISPHFSGVSWLRLRRPL